MGQWNVSEDSSGEDHRGEQGQQEVVGEPGRDGEGVVLLHRLPGRDCSSADAYYASLDVRQLSRRVGIGEHSFAVMIRNKIGSCGLRHLRNSVQKSVSKQWARHLNGIYLVTIGAVAGL